MGLFSSLGIGGPKPQPGNPALAQVGQSLIESLLKKRGAGGPLAIGAAPGEAPVSLTADKLVTPPPEQAPMGALKMGEIAPVGLDPNMQLVDPTKSALDMGKVLGGLPEIQQHHGMLSRIGDYLKSDEGRAALFRSGATTLASGNVGQGFLAGANMVDQRKSDRMAQSSAAAKAAFEEKKLNMGYDVDATNAGTAAFKAKSEEAHYRRGDDNSRFGTESDNYRHSTPSADKLIGAKTDIYNHDNPSGDTRLKVDQDRYQWDHPSATATQQDQGATDRARLQYGNRSKTTTTSKTTVPVHLQGSQAEIAQQARNLGMGSGGAAVNAPAGPVQISSDEEYNALPSGSQFIGPDGQVRMKP